MSVSGYARCKLAGVARHRDFRRAVGVPRICTGTPISSIKTALQAPTTRNHTWYRADYHGTYYESSECPWML